VTCNGDRCAEEICRGLRAKVEWVEHEFGPDDDRCGIFAHVTVGEITGIGSSIKDALDSTLDAATAIRAEYDPEPKASES
jgi:hypothetical protein